MGAQLDLFAPAPVEAPDLAAYDIILVNTSAGKDSQAMLDYLVGLATEAGVLDRVVAVHCDLGRVEWAGTLDLAREQVETYGPIRFEVVRRDQDLLGQIEERGMFPSSTARYCTSDHKTSQVAKLLTRLAAEHRDTHGEDSQVRVLNCLGIRAAESPARARKLPFEHERRASNGRRHVDRWLPIFDWTDAEVWARNDQAPTRHHPAYDEGMPRLSCCFCVLASRSALVRAAQLNPDLAAEYRAVEVRIGHTFQATTSMADIIAEAASTPTPVVASGWNA